MKLEPRWEGIVNTENCSIVLKDFCAKICHQKNVAAIVPTHLLYNRNIKCPLYEILGMLRREYGTNLISNGFKYKEHFNRMYIKMRETGIIARIHNRHGRIKSSINNFRNRYSKPYNVADEGVMFEHVKYIVIAYFMFLPIPLIVLVIENIIHKFRLRKSNKENNRIVYIQ